MCGRYIVVSKLEKLEKRFDVKVSNPDLFTHSANISPGDLAPVITSEKPKLIQFYRFGLMPFWSKKPMYLINARSEGDFNKENDPKYKGQLGIRNKPSFRKSFRSQRCLIPADAFIEGTTKEKLSKPFVVYPIDASNRPFCFAGLYDRWIDKTSGEVVDSFSIITQSAGQLLRKIPHHRSPVILKSKEEEQIWLDPDSHLTDVEIILRPDEENFLNAYPIDPQIKNPRLKDLDLLKPIGERLIPEYDYVLHKDIELFGMGMSPSRKRKLEE